MASCPRIPPELPNIMKDLTKEILRENPANIYEFAARYFESLIRKRDGHLNKNYERFSCPPISSKSLEIQENMKRSGSLRRGRSTGSQQKESPEIRKSKTKVQTFEPSSSISTTSLKKIDRNKSNSRKLLSNNNNNDLAEGKAKYNEPRPSTNTMVGGVSRKISEVTTFDQLDEESGEADGRWLLNRAAIKIQRWVKKFQERKRLRDAHKLKVSDSGFLDEAAMKAAQSLDKDDKQLNDKTPVVLQHDSPTKDDSLLTVTSANLQLLTATLMLQKVVRGFLARKKYKKVLESKIQEKMIQPAIVLQADDDFEDVVEYNESFEFTEELEMAAVAIQKVYRGFHVRKELKEKFNNAAEKILEQTEKKEDDDETIESMNEAAEKIQALYKGHRVRKDLESRKADQNEAAKDEIAEKDSSESNVENVENQMKEESQNGKENSDSTKVENDNVEKDEVSKEANTKVDDDVKPAEETVANDVNMDTELEQAATKIQASYRGFKTRGELNKNKDESNQDEVSQPQNFVEAENNKKEALDSDKTEVSNDVDKDVTNDIDLDAEDVKSAAVTIQKNYKGYKTRKELKDKTNGKTEQNISESKEESDLPELNDETEAAAVSIQKHYKGYKTRKNMNLKKDAKDDKGIDDLGPAKLSLEVKEDEMTSDGKENEFMQKEENLADGKDDEDLETAALTIQKNYKGYKTRKELKYGNADNKSENQTNQSIDKKNEENEDSIKDVVEKTSENNNKEKVINDKTIEMKMKDEVNEKTDVEKPVEEISCKVSETTNKEEEEIDIDLTDPEVQEAAKKIQASFKGRKFRPKSKVSVKREVETISSPSEIKENTSGNVKTNTEINFEEKELQQAATKIQAGFRGHKAREDLKQNKSEKDVKLSEVAEKSSNPSPTKESTFDSQNIDAQNAAVTIQKNFKGYKTRKELQKNHDERSNDSTSSKITDTRKSPELTESQFVVQHAENTAVSFDFENPTVKEISAAKRIQRVYRKHRIDQQLRELKTHLKTVSVLDLSDPVVVEQMTEAAKSIQRFFRVHKKRKSTDIESSGDDGKGNNFDKNEEKTTNTNEEKIHHQDSDTHVSATLLAALETDPHHSNNDTLDEADEKVIELNVHQDPEKSNQSSTPRRNSFEISEPVVEKKVAINTESEIQTDNNPQITHTEVDDMDSSVNIQSSLETFDTLEKCTDPETGESLTECQKDNKAEFSKVQTDADIFLNQSDEQKDQNKTDEMKLKSTVVELIPPACDEDEMSIDSLTTESRNDQPHEPLQDSLDSIASRVSVNEALDDRKPKDEVDEPLFVEKKVEVKEPICVERRMYKCPEAEDGLKKEDIVEQSNVLKIEKDIAKPETETIHIISKNIVDETVKVAEDYVNTKAHLNEDEHQTKKMDNPQIVENNESSKTVENSETELSLHLNEANNESLMKETDKIEEKLTENDSFKVEIKSSESLPNEEENETNEENILEFIPVEVKNQHGMIDDTEVAKVLLDPAIIENDPVLETIEIKTENTEITDKVKEEPQEEIDIDLEDPEVAEAAKKIQASFRGKKFGGKPKKKQTEKNVESTDKISDDDKSKPSEVVVTEKDQEKKSAKDFNSKIPISRSMKSKSMSQDSITNDKTNQVKTEKLKKTTSSADVKVSRVKTLGSQSSVPKLFDSVEKVDNIVRDIEMSKEVTETSNNLPKSTNEVAYSSDEKNFTKEQETHHNEDTKILIALNLLADVPNDEPELKPTTPLVIESSTITSSVDDSSHTEMDVSLPKVKSPEMEDEVSEIVSFDTSTHDKSLLEEEYYSLKKKELQLDSRVSSTGSYSSGVNPKSTTTTNGSSSSKEGSSSSTDSADRVPDDFTTRRTTTMDSDEIIWGKIADSDSSAPSTATDRTVIHLRSLTPEAENILEEYKELARPTTSRGLGQLSKELNKTFSTESDDVVVGTITEEPEKDEPNLNETFIVHKAPKEVSELNKTFIIDKRLDTGTKTADSDDVVFGHINKNGEQLKEPTVNVETEKKSFNDDETLDELKALSDAPPRRRLYSSMSVVQPPSDMDSFNPFLQTSIYQQQYLDKIHGQSMSDTNDTAYGSDRDIEDEDQFDDFYPGNIRQKMMASSFSIADSDYFDPHKPVESYEDRIITALETITSTDSESTTASASTKVANNNARRVLPDSKYSIGNAAITESLDEFVESHENTIADMNEGRDRIANLQKKITRGTKGRFKRNALTEEIPSQASIDEEGEYETRQVIQINVEEKSTESPEKSSESSSEDNRAAFRNKKMSYYSLNVDKYDTAARRSLLQRENAFQKNSTPDDDLSAKSVSAGSNDKKKETSPEHDDDSEKEKTDAEDVEEDEIVTAIETKINPKENKEIETKKLQIQPIPKFQGSDKSDSKPSSAESDDVRFPLLSIMRQRTLPVQIDTSIMRILPKHVVKRIKSANNPNSGSPKPKNKK